MSGRLLAILACASIIALLNVPASASGARPRAVSDTRIDVGSPASPFPQNKQNEPGLAIDEDTAVVGDGQTWHVMGRAGAHLLLDGDWTDFVSGSTFDLPVAEPAAASASEELSRERGRG